MVFHRRHRGRCRFPRPFSTAPPTRVVIDPVSGAIETDLSGLATGGGIGVLSTVKGVPAGDVDLIAPEGVVDAGDAGIRSSGNLNIAATQVLNADNISVSGSSTAYPPPRQSLRLISPAWRLLPPLREQLTVPVRKPPSSRVSRPVR